jgi:hypothetical protein
MSLRSPKECLKGGNNNNRGRNNDNNLKSGKLKQYRKRGKGK